MRSLLALLVGLTLLGQARPLPFTMVWEGGEVVALDARGPYREALKGGKVHRKDLPPLEGVGGYVDFQDGCLWANTYLDDPELLPVLVTKRAADGTLEPAGVLRTKAIRGATILPLRNGKFLGFVRNLQATELRAQGKPCGPVVLLAPDRQGELVVTDWLDLSLGKPYYKVSPKAGESLYAYPSLQADVSLDPLPMRVGETIVLPSYSTGFLFVFSAQDGKFLRRIDFFGIGEDRLQEPFSGAALIALLPTREGSLLVAHRPTVSGGAPPSLDPDLAQTPEVQAAHLEKLERTARENGKAEPTVRWTLVDPATGEQSFFPEPEGLPRPAIGILLGQYRIRFDAAGRLQKVD